MSTPVFTLSRSWVSPATAAPSKYDRVLASLVLPNKAKSWFFSSMGGRIVGTVKRKSDPSNIPLKRRVRLYRDVDGLFVQETWSDTEGNYVFNYIEENMAYTAISYDHTHHFRAVAADNLTLANGGVEIMP